MSKFLIKIGYQKQAGKHIYLLNNGNVMCGNFTYKGRYSSNFKQYYERILEISHKKEIKGIVDVSLSRYWDAQSIYNDYLCKNWQKTISVEKMRKFADESEIREMIKVIQKEFIRAVNLKWKKIFKRSNLSDPSTPKIAWQIL